MKTRVTYEGEAARGPQLAWASGFWTGVASTLLVLSVIGLVAVAVHAEATKEQVESEPDRIELDVPPPPNGRTDEGRVVDDFEGPGDGPPLGSLANPHPPDSEPGSEPNVDDSGGEPDHVPGAPPFVPPLR